MNEERNEEAFFFLMTFDPRLLGEGVRGSKPSKQISCIKSWLPLKFLLTV
jgi:hypothetical protein